MCRLDGIDGGGAAPCRYRARRGQERELGATSSPGCDGLHGVSRGAIPTGVLTEYHHDTPSRGWACSQRSRRPRTS